MEVRDGQVRPAEAEQFFGRTWLRDIVLDWSLREEPCLLLVGEPGIGKSAFLRHFVQEHSAQILAAHFCEGSDSRTLRLSSFVRGLADRLPDKFPEYQRLIRERWRTRELLESLTENPVAALDLAVIETLWEMKRPENRPWFLMVDALDETLTFCDHHPFVEMLAARQERWPSWIRLVFSTRPVPAVLELFAGQRRLVLEAHDARNLDDLRQYLQELSGQRGSAASESLLSLSAGNFLFAKLVGEQEHGDEGLPKSLEDYYAKSLQRVPIQSAKKVLAVLRAAKSPIPIADIAAACEISAENIELVLRQLRPLLRGSQGGFRIYHQSLADFLLSTRCPAEFSLRDDEHRGHKLLGKAAYAAVERGQRPTDYQLRYGVDHLREAGMYGEAISLLAWLRADTSTDSALGEERVRQGRLLAMELPARTSFVPQDLFSLTDCFYEAEPLRRVLSAIFTEHRDTWTNTIYPQFVRSDRLNYVDKMTAGRVMAEGHGSQNRNSFERDPPDVQLHDEEVQTWKLSFQVGASRESYSKFRQSLREIFTPENESKSWWFRYILNELSLHVLLLDDAHLVTEDFVNDALEWSGCHWGYTHVAATDVVALLELRQLVQDNSGRRPYFCNEASVHAARQQLQSIFDERERLSKEFPWAKPLLDDYRRLRACPDKLDERTFDVSAKEMHKNIKDVFPLLLSHPIWHVAEMAASRLASLAARTGHTTEVCEWIDEWLSMAHPFGWRLTYGTIEAAFCTYRTDPQDETSFQRALKQCFASPNCRVRSLCAENAASIVLQDMAIGKRCPFREPFYEEWVPQWIGKTPVSVVCEPAATADMPSDARAPAKGIPVYCPQTLEIMYSFFSQLHNRLFDVESLLPPAESWCPLLAGDEPWYALDRGAFLRRIIANLGRILELAEE